jgi:hypothetical protein
MQSDIGKCHAKIRRKSSPFQESTARQEILKETNINEQKEWNKKKAP